MKFKNKKLKISIILTIVLLIISQAISIYICNNYENETKELITNVLNITYVENTGGAFGIGQNDTAGFVFISLIVIAIIIRFMITQIDIIDKSAVIALSFMLSGGISNLIDRITRGAVIDYIDISKIFKFPVFNISDVLIFTGWLMLIVSVIMHFIKERKIITVEGNEHKDD